MTKRHYSGNATKTTITSAVNDEALVIQIADPTGWPTGGVNGPFFATINRGQINEERILVQSRSGATLTIQSTDDRGADETSATSHSSGSSIEHTYSAVDAREANHHVNDDSRDDHEQYMRTDGTRHDLDARHLDYMRADGGRHDLAARHTFGAALGTPGVPTPVSLTSGLAGTGSVPARADHRHFLDPDGIVQIVNDAIGDDEIVIPPAARIFQVALSGGPTSNVDELLLTGTLNIPSLPYPSLLYPQANVYVTAHSGSNAMARLMVRSTNVSGTIRAQSQSVLSDAGSTAASARGSLFALHGSPISLAANTTHVLRATLTRLLPSGVTGPNLSVASATGANMLSCLVLPNL